MLLLRGKMKKLHSKHTNSDDDPLLQLFFSQLFGALNSKLSSSSSQSTSFSWLRDCFATISVTTLAFAKLVAALDHPITRWEPDSVDRFLNYSLTLLHLLNSITFSLSRLALARLPLSHALSLNQPHSSKLLNPIAPFRLPTVPETTSPDDDDGPRPLSGKEDAVRRAVTVMESLGCWVCRVVLSSLSGCADEFVLTHSPVIATSISIGGGGRNVLEAMAERKVERVKEVRDLNESVARLAEANGSEEAADEARERLEAFERGLEGFESEVDRLFAELFSGRNQLLHGLRVQERKV